MKLKRALGVVLFVVAVVAVPSIKASAFDGTRPLPPRAFDGTRPLPPRAFDGTRPLPPTAQ